MATSSTPPSAIRRLGDATSVLVSISAARAGEDLRWALEAPTAIGHTVIARAPRALTSPVRLLLGTLSDASAATGRFLSDAARRPLRGSDR